MTPQTVNAYNAGPTVEVVFPAAILQPPFFDPHADPAINYGGIGAVIGHEMTHGFDDQGRKIDATGHLRDWWTPEDAAKFEAKAAKYGAEFAAYDTGLGVSINPKLTMGENIADLGGLNLGLSAYHASLHGAPAPVIDGYTGDQRVFLGWAQVWREIERPDAERQGLVTDPHSPGKYRGLTAERNMDAWYKAFDVQPGEKMYIAPEDRVTIW
jgi:putative endopeptidase